MAKCLLEEGADKNPIKIFPSNRALKDGAIEPVPMLRYFDKMMRP
jgi:hypothetical protein